MAIFEPSEAVYIADGATRTFGVPFPVLGEADLYVSVGGVPTPFTYESTRITLPNTPSKGAVVRVYRNTEGRYVRHEFKHGAPLTPEYLDENFRQGLYTTQESQTHVEGLVREERRLREEADKALSADIEESQTHVEGLVREERRLREEADKALAQRHAADMEKLQLSVGFEFVGEYAAGVQLTKYNQIVREGGEFWRASGTTALPYTLTGAGVDEGGALVSVGDANLRQDLADPDKGALMVRGAVIYVDTIADLHALATRELVDGQQVHNSGFYANSNIGGSTWVWDSLAEKNEHDVVNTLDPDRISVWDGSAADLRTLYERASTGQGCFRYVGDRKGADFSRMGIVLGNRSGNTAALELAVAYGVANFVNDVPSDFLAGQAIVNLPDEKVSITGTPDGYIDVRGGPANGIFVLERVHSFEAHKVIVNPVDPLSGDCGCLVSLSMIDKIDSVVVKECTLNRARGFSAGFSGVDSETVKPFRVRSFVFEGNKVDKCYKGMFGRVFSMSNVPYDELIFKDNKIKHFDGAVLRAVGDDIDAQQHCKYVLIEGNRVVWDDDFILDNLTDYDQTNYLCMALVRAQRVVVRHNLFKGVKTSITNVLYDFYLGGTYIYVHDNEYLNSFNLNYTLNGELMKAKGGRGERLVRYSRNRYKIEDEALDKLGLSRSQITHGLFEARDIGGITEFICTDNDIDVCNLRTGRTGESSLNFSRNNIKFDQLVNDAALWILYPPTSAGYITSEDNNITANIAHSYALGSTSSLDFKFIVAGNNILKNSTAPSQAHIGSGTVYTKIIQHGFGQRVLLGAGDGSVVKGDHYLESTVVNDQYTTGRIYVPGVMGEGEMRLSYTGVALGESGRCATILAGGFVADALLISETWRVRAVDSLNREGVISFEYIIRKVDDAGTTRYQVEFVREDDVEVAYYLDSDVGLGDKIKTTVTGNPPTANLTYTQVYSSKRFNFMSYPSQRCLYEIVKKTVKS